MPMCDGDTTWVARLCVMGMPPMCDGNATHVSVALGT